MTTTDPNAPCRCAHPLSAHYHKGQCAGHLSPIRACPCPRFVHAAPKPADEGFAERFKRSSRAVAEAVAGGSVSLADINRREALARGRRAAVLHPPAQAAAAERVELDAGPKPEASDMSDEFPGTHELSGPENPYDILYGHSSRSAILALDERVRALEAYEDASGRAATSPPRSIVTVGCAECDHLLGDHATDEFDGCGDRLRECQAIGCRCPGFLITESGLFDSTP